MKALLIASLLFLANTQKTVKSDQILGRWMADSKDLTVEVFRENGRYAARIVWFECTEAQPRKLAAHRDTNNPDPKLRGRSWLGMVVVDDLTFDPEENEWSGGNIYDPNSGHTFRSVVRMNSPQQFTVRGYWGIELLGKNLHFTRL